MAQIPNALFSPSSKNKKIHPDKISYILGKWNFLTLKNFLHFLKRKLLLYFREWKPRKKFLYFGKQKPPIKTLYFLKKKAFLSFRKRKPWQNSLYFRKWNFLCTKNEKILLKSFLYLEEMRLSYYKLKKLFIFQEGTDKALKTNRKSAPKKLLVLFNVLVIFTGVWYRKTSCDYLYSAVKHRVIPCDYLHIIFIWNKRIKAL